MEDAIYPTAAHMSMGGGPGGPGGLVSRFQFCPNCGFQLVEKPVVQHHRPGSFPTSPMLTPSQSGDYSQADGKKKTAVSKPPKKASAGVAGGGAFPSGSKKKPGSSAGGSMDAGEYGGPMDMDPEDAARGRSRREDEAGAEEGAGRQQPPRKGKSSHGRIPQSNLKHTDFILRKPYRDINECYDVHDHELGVGQFGVIRSCVSREIGTLLACKTISKDKILCVEDADDVRKEVQYMQQLRGHPSIIELRETFEDVASVHLVMELCKGGELFDRIKMRGKYSEPDAAMVFQTLVGALVYLHSNGIVHRDIKPENILLLSTNEDTKIKLIDFGVATRFTPGEPLNEFVGTPYYMAPELLEGAYGAESDIWSAGVVLYIMLSGVPPFWAQTNEGIFEAIQHQELRFKSKKWNDVSEEAKDLLRMVLNKDPYDRISGLEILNHPWMVGNARGLSGAMNVE